MRRAVLTAVMTTLAACGDASAPTPASDAAPTPSVDMRVDTPIAPADAPPVSTPDASPDAAAADAAAADATPKDSSIAGDGAAEAGTPATPACLDWGATTPEMLGDWLRKVSGEIPVTVGGASLMLGERFTAGGRMRARAWLRGEYEGIGYAVSEPSYGTGTNLVAAKTGGGDQMVIVGGHYDTVEGVPGADDNGSGVVATLAVARALRGCTIGRSLQFVAFDEEERGAIGSRAFAGGLRNSGEAARVHGAFSLDMLGYETNDDGKVLIVDCDRAESVFLTERLMAHQRALGLGLVASNVCRMGGDWRSFWDARIPAIAFGEEFFVPNADSNPCYHRACDRVDRINLGYFSRLTKAVAATVAELTQAR